MSEVDTLMGVLVGVTPLPVLEICSLLKTGVMVPAVMLMLWADEPLNVAWPVPAPKVIPPGAVIVTLPEYVLFPL
jgi:hypothetical protein